MQIINLQDIIHIKVLLAFYLKIYQGVLKTDFPYVPYPNDLGKFRKLVVLGEELCQLHALKSLILNQLITDFSQSGKSLVEEPYYDNGKIYINITQYFEVVPQFAWEFYIAGYKPAQKWLTGINL